MNKEHQETLLQTIRARLERNEKGNIEALFDANGSWTIVPYTNTGLVKYFEPAYETGVDLYGNTHSDKI